MEELVNATEHVKNVVSAIKHMINEVLQKGVDYGSSGGPDRPTLLQPGAQKIAHFFNAVEEYNVQQSVVEEAGRKHFVFVVTCTLKERDLGYRMGEGVGAASTLESKYRYRKTVLKCPNCGANAVVPSKYGGYYCSDRLGGCKSKFSEDTFKNVSPVTETEPGDFINTAIKMACKRAYVAAVLSMACASAVFTQDVGPESPEMPAEEEEHKAETTEESSDLFGEEPKKTGLTPNQVKFFERLLSGNKITDANKWLAENNLPKFEDLTQSDFDKIVKILAKK